MIGIIGIKFSVLPNCWPMNDICPFDTMFWQSRIILPKMTACFECSLELFPPQVNFPMCTIAHTPRLPEHCIEWANVVHWPEVWKDTKFDADNSDHMEWMYKTALKRADEFKISGVTYRLTQGVVKNIIPAIASTNAIIAASECNEAWKFATNVADNLNNWMMINGGIGMYTHTFEYEKKESCAVCGNSERSLSITPTDTLEDFIAELGRNPDVQLKKPSIRCEGKSLYMQGILSEQTKHNLPKTMGELIKDGDQIEVTDPNLPSVAMVINVSFKK